MRHGWVEFHAGDEIDVETLRDAKRKVYALAISAERAEHWQGLWDAEGDRQPRVHGVVVPVSEASENAALEPDGLALARDGLPWPELADLRRRVVTQLVG